MEVLLENTGKRYQREWIFRNLSYQFSTGSYAITGKNGSGKSTLAAVISGQLLPNEGKIQHLIDNRAVDEHEVYKYLALSAPYLELIEEFTVLEMIRFHFRVKKMKTGLNADDFLAYTWLESAGGKQVKHLSSGMKQRFKLGLVFFTDCPLYILDEPTTNLDIHGIKWYGERLNEVIEDHLIIICSNQPHEYEMCRNTLSIEDFK